MYTVEFYPAKYKIPTLSTRSIAVKDAVELTEALQNMTDPTKIQFNNSELKELKNSLQYLKIQQQVRSPKSGTISNFRGWKKFTQIIAWKIRITLQMVNFQGWTDK